MSKPLRIQYPDAWYHLMNRGRRREEIYIDKGDYLAFYWALGLEGGRSCRNCIEASRTFSQKSIRIGRSHENLGSALE